MQIVDITGFERYRRKLREKESDKHGVIDVEPVQSDKGDNRQQLGRKTASNNRRGRK